MSGFQIKRNELVTIYYSKTEDSAVKIAVENFCEDIKRICGARTKLVEVREQAMICIETKEACPFLCDENGVPIWEAYGIAVTDGVLTITGTNRRGTIYGMYELSKRWGMSPWYWFADVPIKTKDCISLPEGFFETDAPSVKYRGIFLNDEEELEAWAISYMKESTIGPATYEKIFELLLRLKANYIWPAMHVNAFNHNKENAALAHRMGIVVGTSHCDMLLRSNQNEWYPWIKEKGYDAQYDYSIGGENRRIIHEYWSESVNANKDYEVCYTLGMRGIHDSGFVTREISNDKTLSEEEKKQRKIHLLEEVIRNQQAIIDKHSANKDNFKTFIPYKEVMNLYDAGLNVPEDITIVWVNDNFGYMRRYPSKVEQKRMGGHGLYYHVSYWAHPGMSYLFFNSTPLSHVKNELKKAYENGIQKLWVLNVGALKPLELDLDFYLTFAWEVRGKETYTKRVSDFIEHWYHENFSGSYGSEVASLYEEFTQILNVRKLEHMTSDVFSQTAYGNEAAERMLRFKRIYESIKAIHQALPKEEQAAFFQMIAMKIYAAYYVNASYYYADRSRLMYDMVHMNLAEQYTQNSKEMDEFKRRLLFYYNKRMMHGKWDNILTPESFLPPCMALHPACKPALCITEEQTKVESEMDLFLKDTTTDVTYISMLAEHGSSSKGWNRIEHLGRYEGALMEADCVENNYITFDFCTAESGAFLLELYRFPTLNAKGRIRLSVSIDQREPIVIESLATDEWRDTWKENVMNNGEKLQVILPTVEAGIHKLTLVAFDRYVSLSKVVIYTNGYEWSNLGPRESDRIVNDANDSYFVYYESTSQRTVYSFAPDIESLDQETKTMFACEKAPLRDVIYADKRFWKKDRLYLKNDTKKPSVLGKKKYQRDENGCKNVFRHFGSGAFTEAEGRIAFGSEYVLEQSENAFQIPATDGTMWEHTQSESDGGTGLAMYVAKKNQFYRHMEGAPLMNYKIKCEGGHYHCWLLLKYDDEPNARIGFAIDKKEIPQEQMYSGGWLYNYGTHQNWVWMLVTDLNLTKGSHLFTICARASEFRIDRIYLSKGDEYPPMDEEWVESKRI